MKCVQLSNGFKYPLVGYGTWMVPNDKVDYCVTEAIKCGYRCLDCAYAYLNEKEIGDTLTKCYTQGLVKREDLYITSKLWNTFHRQGKTEVCLNETLKNLKTNYLDLYLIHWPMSFKEGPEPFPSDPETGKLLTEVNDYCRIWGEMEQMVAQGKVKNIGLSNFNVNQIEKVLSVAKIKPSMLQIEISVQWPNQSLIKFCQKNDIAITAYCTLGHLNVLDNSAECLISNAIVKDIANKKGCTPAQILLRYCTQRDICVIPKTLTVERMMENLNHFDVQLTPEEFSKLETVPQMRVLPMDSYKDHPHFPFH